MPAAQQSGQQQQEGSLDFLWVILIGMAAVFALWYFAGDSIIRGVFTVKSYELSVVRFSFNVWNKLAILFSFPTVNTNKIDVLYNFVTTQKEAIDYKVFFKVAHEVGKYLRFPLTLILIFMAVRVYSGSVTSRFRTEFKMDYFREIEHENWPRISPVLKLDLSKQNIDEGPWAMAMTPVQFSKNNNLVTELTENGKTVLTLDKGKAHRIFALQLGKFWTGDVNSLPEHVKCLLAVFAGRIVGDIDLTDKILDEVALSTFKGKPDFSSTEELLLKYLPMKEVARTMQQHAYIYTMMSSMLEVARGSGVVASADFLWVKPLDRKLWYSLNCVGRQTAFAESAGVFSHWLVEKKFKRPFKVPMVDNAVKSLEEALQDILYEPEL